MKRANLFIVGSLKVGTCSFYNLFSNDERICMSNLKEPDYFDTDLKRRSEEWRGYNMEWGVNDSKTYHNLFSKCSGNEKYWGEASVWYLYSMSAPAEIYSYNPDAKIVIGIREPVSWIKSYYGQILSLSTGEDENDFRKAISKEKDRKKFLKDIPSNVSRPEMLFYRDLADFEKWVKNWFNYFPPEQIFIYTLEEMKKNPKKKIKEIYNFLGLSPYTLEFPHKNSQSNKNYRKNSQIVEKLTWFYKKSGVKKLVPYNFQRKYISWIVDNLLSSKCEIQYIDDKHTTNYLKGYFEVRVEHLDKFLSDKGKYKRGEIKKLWDY